MSSSEAVKAGLRGKAVKICHYYRDLLWYAPKKPYRNINKFARLS